MNDSELEAVWIRLEPLAAQRRRIETRLRSWLEARNTSLAAEWLELLKANPIAKLAVAVMAAFLMLAATPFSWVALALL